MEEQSQLHGPVTCAGSWVPALGLMHYCRHLENVDNF